MTDTRKKYTVRIGGIDHTLLLTEQGAKRRGGVLVAPVKVRPVAKK